MKKAVLVGIIASTAVCFTSIIAQATTINLKSGNAAPGQYDPSVTVRGANVTIAGVQYTAANQPLTQARVFDPSVGMNWIWPGTVSNTGWVIPDPAPGHPKYAVTGGYIFETTFELPKAFMRPSIQMTCATDDDGEVYLNGHLLGTGTNYWQSQTFSSANASWFAHGTNKIEFRLYNDYIGTGEATPCGVDFAATVNYTPLPEPGSLFALMGGIIGVGRFALKQKR